VTVHLQLPLGFQRDWLWRGWTVRYTHLRALSLASEPGQNLPLLFLHGFGSALTQWRENLLPLNQAHPVYALDLVGFGASEKAATAYRVELWADQVYDFWRTFIGRPIVLVGHSLGALVALTAAVSHPEIVQGLVLITLPAARQELLPGWLQPIVGTVESWFTTPLLTQPLFRLIRRPSVIRAVLRKVYVNQERVTEALIESFLTPGQDQGAVRAFGHLARARTDNDFCRATKELLQDLTVPTLLLWGEKDQVIPLAWGRQLPPLNAHLKLVEIPNAGHCPYDEAAAEVNAAILAWVAALPDATG